MHTSRTEYVVEKIIRKTTFFLYVHINKVLAMVFEQYQEKRDAKKGNIQK